jgi:hypothetical protein
VSTNVAPKNARENLYYAILAPGLRSGAFYNTTSAFAGADNDEIRKVNKVVQLSYYYALPEKIKTERLSLYSPIDNLNIPENSIEITGQNLDFSISRYTIDSIFTENTYDESYIWSKQANVPTITKTLYFADQFNQKFFAGDTVKIRNSNSGYVNFVTVLSATSNSITYADSNLVPDVSGTFIESGTTVYSKLLSSSIGPKPLRNFNISVATPGKNATKSFGYGQQSATSTFDPGAAAVKRAPIQFWS